jgi:hypothetical protein
MPVAGRQDTVIFLAEEAANTLSAAVNLLAIFPEIGYTRLQHRFTFGR